MNSKKWWKKCSIFEKNKNKIVEKSKLTILRVSVQLDCSTKKHLVRS